MRIFILGSMEPKFDPDTGYLIHDGAQKYAEALDRLNRFLAKQPNLEARAIDQAVKLRRLYAPRGWII